MKKPTPKVSTSKPVTLFPDLFPLTKQREVTACEMGMRFGFVTRYKPQYFLRDTIIILWLRSIPVDGKGWTVDRAESEPEAAMKEALQWAERKGIGIDTKPFAEAYLIFTATMQEVQQAKGEPVLPADTKKDPDDSEL